MGANGIALVMNAQYLYGRWLFPRDIELGGYRGFLIRDRISGKMGNDVRVREWAYVWASRSTTYNNQILEFVRCVVMCKSWDGHLKHVNFKEIAIHAKEKPLTIIGPIAIMIGET